MNTRDSSETLSVVEARRAWLASLLLRQQTTWFGRFTLHFQRLLALGRGGRRRLERKAAVSLAGAALLLALGVGAMRPPAVHAATITVDGTICTLVDAITAANTDTATGGCLAGSGADTIDLQTDVSLLVSNNYSFLSDTGLPVVTTDITIDGNGNTIERNGAAGLFRLLAVNPTGALTINDTTLYNGRSQDRGGAIYNDRGTLTLTDSTVGYNKAEGDGGGGIFNFEGTLTLTNSFVTDNDAAAAQGGGIYNSGGTVSLTDSTVNDNYADSSGGGIYTIDGSLTLSNSTVRDNETDDHGGGIYNDDGTLTVTNSTISGNSGTRGGGFYHVGGTMTVTDSTVNDNSATEGGGAYIDFDVSDNATVVTFVNSTISNNTAGSDGGAIYLDEGNLTLINTTITGNEAGDRGGGLFTFFNSAIVHFNRSIVSGNNAAESDEFHNRGDAPSTADNYNVFGDSGLSDIDAFSNFTPGANDFNATTDGTPTALAAILDTTLAVNGGSTMTHALVANSPAIDFGPSADCTAAPVNGVDQRGFGRNVDVPLTGDDGGPNLCDSGAYEYLAVPPVVGYCPVDDMNVGTQLTTVLGTGQGSPTKGFRTRKLVVPNSDEVVALYGQLAAIETGVMKYVRFLPQGYPKEQIAAPTSAAYRTFAVDWWGTDLPADANSVKGQFFWGAKANKSPRAFVLWPTYETAEEYANTWVLFDNSSENHVAWEPGFIPSQEHFIAIPETQQEGASIKVTVALVDVNKDSRPVFLWVSAGGVSNGRYITVPNKGLTLNLEEFILDDVAEGTDEVTVYLESPTPSVNFPLGGDSAAMIGVAINYACETVTP